MMTPLSSGMTGGLLTGRRWSRSSTPLVASGGVTPTVDSTGPTVSSIAPSSPEFDQPMVFSVTDTSGLRRVLVTVQFLSRDDVEVVHDGSAFTGKYRGLSYRSAITNGFQYVIARTGGWPTHPTMRVVAIDTLGNETTRTS